jgi:hypothetical protein
MSFDPYNFPQTIQKSIRTLIPKVRVHFTLSHTPESMKCDSWASFLARNFASLCITREPNARVATFRGIFKGYIRYLRAYLKASYNT